METEIYLVSKYTEDNTHLFPLAGYRQVGYTTPGREMELLNHHFYVKEHIPNII